MINLSPPLAYPGQVGIRPVPLRWGASTAQERGPIVVSRHPGSLKIRQVYQSQYGDMWLTHRNHVEMRSVHMVDPIACIVRWQWLSVG
jgi:hypothetical protein